MSSILSANALALQKCIKRPCMVYEESLDKSKIKSVKLSEVIDDIKKVKECPTFDGTDDIEGLLYAEERFRKVAHQLQFFTGAELYDSFEEILMETAEENWAQITANTLAAARTPATFDAHIQELYTKYVDHDARDQMFSYIVMLKKGRSSTPSEHVNRMTTLLRYSNKLPGTEPIKDDNRIKQIIFNSFPDNWKIQFNRSGRILANESMAQVLQFMRDEKNYSDKDEEKKKAHKNNGNKSHGSKRKNDFNGKQDRKRSNKSNPCKYHDGHHDWKDCIFNPRSKNYRPDRQRPQLPRKGNDATATPPPHQHQNKPGGYRQGPHYHYGSPQVPPSYMYLPPAPSAPPCPPNGSVPSDVSWNSYYTGLSWPHEKVANLIITIT